MSHGGPRAGAGRKAFPEGTRRERADGRIFEKRAGRWVQIAGSNQVGAVTNQDERTGAAA